MADTSADNLHSVRLKVDLSDLPQEVDLSPSRIGAFFGMVFGVVCALASWFFGPLPGARDSDFQAFLLIFPAIGAAIFLGSLVSLFRKRRATFRSDGVEVEGRGLLRRESWYSPYSGFRGVLHRQEVSRRKDSSTTYQIIELLHDDRKKCLPLFIEASSEMPRGRWEGYAKQLKIPALELEEGEVVEPDRRDPG